MGFSERIDSILNRTELDVVVVEIVHLLRLEHQC